MKQHNENALKAAEFLDEHPKISFVSYPGLKNHENHQVANSQMSQCYRDVLAFRLKADHDTHNNFVSHLNLITSAVSLGHDESLIVFIEENNERQYLYPEKFHNGFFRLSVDRRSE
jgi:methionine-gamma-lyase